MKRVMVAVALGAALAVNLSACGDSLATAQPQSSPTLDSSVFVQDVAARWSGDGWAVAYSHPAQVAAVGASVCARWSSPTETFIDQTIAVHNDISANDNMADELVVLATRDMCAQHIGRLDAHVARSAAQVDRDLGRS